MRGLWCFLPVAMALAHGPRARCQAQIDSIEPASYGTDSVLGAGSGPQLLDPVVTAPTGTLMLTTPGEAPNLTSGEEQVDTVLTDTRRDRLHTTGGIEVGGIRGPIPYTLSGPGSWNGYLKGTVTAELYGLPLTVLFDLGTDEPIRGRRNSINLSFDAPRILDKQKWGQAEKLADLQNKLGSLQTERTEQYRILLGTKAQLGNLPAIPVLPGLPTTTIPDSTSLAVVMPEADSMEIDLPDVAAMDTFERKIPDIPKADATLSRSDSLMEQLEHTQRRINELDDKVKTAQAHIDRLTALVNAGKGKGTVLTGFLHGIKKFSIGNCTPNTSDFLINGITFQGVSFEYDRKDLYLAFDRGRSFDDTWRDTDPVSRGLRSLQETLFFTDGKDLDPRKLTALKVGWGSREQTHFHLGYLTGTRSNLPLGAEIPTVPSSKLRNQVVELDMAIAINKNNLLSLILARSIVQSSIEQESENPADDGMSRLFTIGGEHDQAVRVGWTSNFSRTGTRAGLEMRSISPFFQSFGMGFIRNGTRAAEAKLDQVIAKKWRFRGRYTLEERKRSDHEATTTTKLNRAQAQVSYKVDRSWTLRAGYMPVMVRASTAMGEDLVNENRNYSFGMNWRKRIKSTVLYFTADEGFYQWRSGDGMAQRVENHALTLTAQHKEVWGLQMTWTGLGGTMKDTAMSSSDSFSFSATGRIRSKYSLTAGLQVARNEAMGWLFEFRAPLRKNMIATLRGESFPQNALSYEQSLAKSSTVFYNCSASLTFLW